MPPEIAEIAPRRVEQGSTVFRFPLRNRKPADLDSSAWMADREVPIQLLSLSGLTTEEAQKLGSYGIRANVYLGGSASWIWLAGVRLPPAHRAAVGPVEIAPEAEKIRLFDIRIVKGMREALEGFDVNNASSGSKRRRINRVLLQMKELERVSANAPPVALPPGLDVLNQGRQAFTPASSSGETSRMCAFGPTHDGQSLALDTTRECMESGEEAQLWVDFTTWLARIPMPTKPLLSLRPEFGNKQMPSACALVKLREQLSFKALYEVSRSKIVNIHAGSLHTPKKESHILMPRLRGKSQKSSSKYQVIWIAEFQTIKYYIENQLFADFETLGVRRCVVGENSGRIVIKPRVKELVAPDGRMTTLSTDGVRVVVVFVR